MAGIALSRAAGEKRQEAQQVLNELKDTVEKQMAGELDEESRLTADEINQQRKRAADLIAEAEALEGVDSLDGIMSRPADEVDEEAKRILQDQENRGGIPEAKSPFETIGEFLRSVRTESGKYDTPVDMTRQKRRALHFLYKQATKLEQGERLETKELGELDLKTLVGDDTTSTGRGDYLVPTEHMEELLRTMGESQQFANRARRVPMSRRTADFPRLKQTDANDTRPMFSFAAVSKIAEGAQKQEREPVFEQLTLTAIKYAAYVEAADELLSDSIVGLQPVLVDLLTNAIAYEYDRDTIRGSGTAEPQGFIGSSAEYAVNREATNAISTTDVFNLESRFFGDENGIYMFHPSIIPLLYGLNSANVIAWQRDISSSAPGVLLGRPLVRTHKLPTRNNKGDLALVDPSFYLVGDLQRVTVMNSIHYQFRNDVTAWRATFRAAGTPWPAGTFSHESDGSTKTWEVSPFVTLDIISS